MECESLYAEEINQSFVAYVLVICYYYLHVDKSEVIHMSNIKH